MRISVVFANGIRNAWIKYDVPESGTANEIIEQSGILEQFPDIDLKWQKVGIFGKLDARVSDGSRIEIYGVLSITVRIPAIFFA